MVAYYVAKFLLGLVTCGDQEVEKPDRRSFTFEM